MANNCAHDSRFDVLVTIKCILISTIFLGIIIFSCQIKDVLCSKTTFGMDKLYSNNTLEVRHSLKYMLDSKHETYST